LVESGVTDPTAQVDETPVILTEVEGVTEPTLSVDELPLILTTLDGVTVPAKPVEDVPVVAIVLLGVTLPTAKVLDTPDELTDVSEVRLPADTAAELPLRATVVEGVSVPTDAVLLTPVRATVTLGLVAACKRDQNIWPSFKTAPEVFPALAVELTPVSDTVKATATAPTRPDALTPVNATVTLGLLLRRGVGTDGSRVDRSRPSTCQIWANLSQINPPDFQAR
jgi:hypothetical protein